MNFRLENIVNLDMVGEMKVSTKIPLLQYGPYTASNAKTKALVIIDPQNDFIANEGSLKVEGAIDDTKRLIKHIYNNISDYKKISVTLDTHYKDSIFFPMAWVSLNKQIGEVIKPEDIGDSEKDYNNYKYIPVMDMPSLQKEYVKKITEAGKQLIIWPYHCIIGTPGHAIEYELYRMLEFWEDYQGKEVDKIIKGTGRYTEHYGALRPEIVMDVRNDINEATILWLDDLSKYRTIDICGQAKDYCVYETVKQMCKYYQDNYQAKGITERIHVLYNLSSCIGDSDECWNKYQDLVNKYHITIDNVGEEAI